MHSTDILALTRDVPFRPFRVFLTTGETFDITHPDMILTTVGAAHIAVPVTAPTPLPTYTAKIVSLMHIQKFEYLPPPGTPATSPTASGGAP